jgi:alkyl hydroperoxide reductase subunit AhpF
MASRRKLKQTIKFVSSELITDIFFRSLMSKEIQSEKINQLVMDVAALSREFTLRANRPDGKENPKLVKTYYRKLFADWQTAIDKVIKEIEAL